MALLIRPIQAAERSPILSVIEPTGKRWTWKRVNPLDRHSEVIASFYAPASVIDWSPDRARALVKLESETLAEVAIASKQVAVLPNAPKGELQRGAYDRSGHPVALTLYPLQGFETHPQGKRQTIVFEGQSFYWDGYGLPSIVFAYRYVAGKWQEVERQLTRTDEIYRVPTQTLKTAQSLPTSHVDDLRTSIYRDAKEVNEPALVQKLDRFKPSSVEHVQPFSWYQLSTLNGVAFICSYQVDFEHFCRPLVFCDDGVFSPAEGLQPTEPSNQFSGADNLAIQLQVPYLLASTERTRAKPRLYDLRSRQLVYFSDTAIDATFWPK